VVSLYAGEVGISRTFEGLGQRDEPAILAFGEALAFQAEVGLATIEARARALAGRLMSGLRKIDGVTVWTHADASRATSVVSFRPGSLDPAKLAASLFEREGIVCAVRGGADRGGLRCSPHVYNTMSEVEALVSAVGRAMRGTA
jgi:selenocysteine lyase/cysteine desulfurase